ncbi:MAG: hypothetical protein M1840_007871 [Geoglossum simile]|nr:MAG: hypothetical protein M1840_007871 [Geoglossum simile]
MNIQNMMNPRPEEEELQEAIKRGYLIVTSSQPAPDGLVLAAKAELYLTSAASASSSNLWAYHVPGRGPKCEQLFEEGFDFPKNRFLTYLLGRPYTATAAETYTQRAFVTVYNPKPLPPVRAGDDNVLIWRTFDKPLNATNGFFRVVVGSSGMGEADYIEIQDNQALILDGERIIQYSQGGSGLGQYKLVRKSSKDI